MENEDVKGDTTLTNYILFLNIAVLMARPRQFVPAFVGTVLKIVSSLLLYPVRARIRQRMVKHCPQPCEHSRGCNEFS